MSELGNGMRDVKLCRGKERGYDRDLSADQKGDGGEVVLSGVEDEECTSGHSDGCVIE